MNYTYDYFKKPRKENYSTDLAGTWRRYIAKHVITQQNII